MTTQPVEDVRAHVHRADLAPEAGNQPGFGPKSARPGARAGARVPHLHLVDQEPAPDSVPDDPIPGSNRPGAGLAEELRAAVSALDEAAGDSDWATPPMNPVEAWKQLAPSKGEAGNWIIWTAMAAAGLARGIWVSLGYLVLRGTETRIRASVATAALLVALVLAFLTGHAS